MSDVRIDTQPVFDEFQILRPAEEVFKNPTQLDFFRSFLDIVRRLFAKTIRTDRAAPYVLLNSPDGKAWYVRVTNAGTVEVSQARG